MLQQLTLFTLWCCENPLWTVTVKLPVGSSGKAFDLNKSSPIKCDLFSNRHNWVDPKKIAFHLYLWGDQFESRLGRWIPWVRKFVICSVVCRKIRIVPWITSRSLPSPVTSSSSFSDHPNIIGYFYKKKKTNQMHQFLKIDFFFGKALYMFRRSFRPSSGVQYCTYSNRHMSNRYCCLLASKRTTIAVCTVLNSWWWTERASETCRVLFQSKINSEKLEHLVGFTIGIY